eukprot:9076694-Pyramimonas_sp.AAC.1
MAALISSLTWPTLEAGSFELPPPQVFLRRRRLQGIMLTIVLARVGVDRAWLVVGRQTVSLGGRATI